MEEWDKFQNDLLTSVRVANDFKNEAQQELQKFVMENKAHRERIRALEAQLEKTSKGKTDQVTSSLTSACACPSTLTLNTDTTDSTGYPTLGSRRGSNISAAHIKRLSKRDRELIEHVNREYAKIDLEHRSPEDLSPDELAIVKLKQSYDRHFGVTHQKPTAKKPLEDLAVSRPLLTSVLQNPNLKSVAQDDDVLNVESREFYEVPRSQSMGDINKMVHDENFQEAYLQRFLEKEAKTKRIDQKGPLRVRTIKQKHIKKKDIGLPIYNSVLNDDDLLKIIKDDKVAEICREESFETRYMDPVKTNGIDDMEQKIKSLKRWTDTSDDKVFVYSFQDGAVKVHRCDTFNDENKQGPDTLKSEIMEKRVNKETKRNPSSLEDITFDFNTYQKYKNEQKERVSKLDMAKTSFIEDLVSKDQTPPKNENNPETNDIPLEDLIDECELFIQHEMDHTSRNLPIVQEGPADSTFEPEEEKIEVGEGNMELFDDHDNLSQQNEEDVLYDTLNNDRHGHPSLEEEINDCVLFLYHEVNDATNNLLNIGIYSEEDEGEYVKEEDNEFEDYINSEQLFPVADEVDQFSENAQNYENNNGYDSFNNYDGDEYEDEADIMRVYNSQKKELEKVDVEPSELQSHHVRYKSVVKTLKLMFNEPLKRTRHDSDIVSSDCESDKNTESGASSEEEQVCTPPDDAERCVQEDHIDGKNVKLLDWDEKKWTSNFLANEVIWNEYKNSAASFLRNSLRSSGWRSTFDDYEAPSIDLDSLPVSRTNFDFDFYESTYGGMDTPGPDEPTVETPSSVDQVSQGAIPRVQSPNPTPEEKESEPEPTHEVNEFEIEELIESELGADDQNGVLAGEISGVKEKRDLFSNSTGAVHVQCATPVSIRSSEKVAALKRRFEGVEFKDALECGPTFHDIRSKPRRPVEEVPKIDEVKIKVETLDDSLLPQQEGVADAVEEAHASGEVHSSYALAKKVFEQGK